MEYVAGAAGIVITLLLAFMGTRMSKADAAQNERLTNLETMKADQAAQRGNIGKLFDRVGDLERQVAGIEGRLASRE